MTITFYDHFAGWGSPLGGATPSIETVSQIRDGVNPKFNLAYEFNKDLMVYVTASKGFRPGGAQPAAARRPVHCGRPAACHCRRPVQIRQRPVADELQPDTSWSYELGEKARLFDRHLTVDSSVYYEKWSNVQLWSCPTITCCRTTAAMPRSSAASSSSVSRSATGSSWAPPAGILKRP